jgi:hypothetical protein
MSLLVNVYTRDENGKMEFIDPEDSSEELAGFEAFRRTFYGGQTALSMGLQLLPQLAQTDLYCEFAELEQLKEEANMIQKNVGSFTREAGKDEECLQFRIKNILAAISRAERVGGGVVIW